MYVTRGVNSEGDLFQITEIGDGFYEVKVINRDDYQKRRKWIVRGFKEALKKAKYKPLKPV